MECAITPEGCKIDGLVYPSIGFGTYPLKDKLCENAVSDAIKLGYRIIDTATYYKNFVPIGNVLKPLKRKEFYLISKVWPDAQRSEQMRKDIHSTLLQLQTDYLDAYLLHWPFSQNPIEESLQTMEKIKTQGLIRHIGMSNVTVHHLKRALKIGVPISWVQVEMHPHFCDFALLHFCHEKNICIQAWGPLARGRLVNDALLTTLGTHYQKTAAQIALNWILQHHCLPLPGSKNINHMRENLESPHFTLSKNDINQIDQLAMKGKRERIIPEWNLNFTDEFDFSYEECWPPQ